MKSQNKKATDHTGNKTGYMAGSINTCISCGAEIPEGMLVCMGCDNGVSVKKRTAFDRLVSKRESVRSSRNFAIFRFKSKN